MSASPHMLLESRAIASVGDWKMIDSMIVEWPLGRHNQYHHPPRALAKHQP